MTVAVLGRPEANEYAPYYSKYIDLVSGDDVVTALRTQLTETLAVLNKITDEHALHRYAPGKWSIKELLGHIIDGERIMAYRALRFARNDKTPIEGFDQDPYIENASFDSYAMKDLIDEFTHVRQANIHLFRGLTPEAGRRTGLANNNEVSVRALAYVIAGHELHHINVLKAEYLK